MGAEWKNADIAEFTPPLNKENAVKSLYHSFGSEKGLAWQPQVKQNSLGELCADCNGNLRKASDSEENKENEVDKNEQSHKSAASVVQFSDDFLIKLVREAAAEASTRARLKAIALSARSVAIDMRSAADRAAEEVKRLGRLLSISEKEVAERMLAAHNAFRHAGALEKAGYLTNQHYIVDVDSDDRKNAVESLDEAGGSLANELVSREQLQMDYVVASAMHDMLVQYAQKYEQRALEKEALAASA